MARSASGSSIASVTVRHRIGRAGAGVLAVMVMVGAAACGPPPAPRAPAPAAADRLADGIARIVEEEVAAGHVPGAVVLVGHGGRVVYERAFGARALAPEREAMTTDTVFDAASLTKVVATTTAVLQLVDAGRLELDAPVARYWPAFGGGPERLGERAGKGAITVRQLLAHTSGLRPDLDLRARWSGTDAALARVVAERPLAPPGTRVVYSDVNFVVLGELVRRVTGEPLDRYCAARVFAPLAMRTTTFTPPEAWRARIAPTVRERGGFLRGVVHDPTARRMGGVAGHAGLFTTAADLARFAQALLDAGRGKDTIVSARAAATMTTPQDPAARRGLGWELAGPEALGGGAAFSAHAFGHTGYTGTSLWIDPDADTYLVVLTNRVHPDDTGVVRPLRARLATLVAASFRIAAAPAGTVPIAAPPATIAGPVAPGIDVLAAEGFAPLAGRRVGLVTNHSGRDAAGRRTIDVLDAAPGVRLAAIFTPEHGLDGSADAIVPSGREPRLGIPVHSLYGPNKRPTPAQLADVDALVFDVQDVGVRFYTYVTTLGYAMEAAAARGIPIWVLDRPNPIDAGVVQGPVLEDDLRSFTGYFALPVRYGLTIGELATLLNAEKPIGADLHVVRMRSYARDRWYDGTGLAWVPPSPNLRSLRQATLYPGVALVEGANVSVGRGTATPFELVGAPWIDGERLAAYLNARQLGGVRFEPVEFTPEDSAYRGERCSGVRLVLTDRARLDAPALGIELASALHRLHSDRFRLEATTGMVGARWVVQAIRDGDDPRTIAARWQPALARFAAIRGRYLLY